MENLQQIERGIAMFVDREMATKMPKAAGIAFAAFAPLWVKGKIKQISPELEVMGLKQGDDIDLDTAYQLYKASAHGKWPMELLRFKFSEEDLDKLYRTIKEA